MAGEVDLTLRGPGAYDLARKALEAMENLGVWPTPVNFELWLHYLGDPEGALGKEMARLLVIGEPFTEALSEELAASFLPKARLNEQIRDAGDQLSRELAAVSKAIDAARSSSNSYGQTLAGVTKDLAQAEEHPVLQGLVETLSTATK